MVEESYTPQADVTLALASPPGLFLADACGGVARSGRLASGCRLPLADLAVLGGSSYRILPAPRSGTTVAVYPAHAKLGELHLAFLQGSTRQLTEAWPGLADLRRMVVLEWSGDRVFDPDPVAIAWSTRWRGGHQPPLSVLGNLVLLSEWDLLNPRHLEAGGVRGRAGGLAPLAPAPVRPGGLVLFHQLFRELALQRLGLGPESGATVVGLGRARGVSERAAAEGFLQPDLLGEPLPRPTDGPAPPDGRGGSAAGDRRAARPPAGQQPLHPPGAARGPRAPRRPGSPPVPAGQLRGRRARRAGARRGRVPPGSRRLAGHRQDAQPGGRPGALQGRADDRPRPGLAW